MHRAIPISLTANRSLSLQLAMAYLLQKIVCGLCFINSLGEGVYTFGNAAEGPDQAEADAAKPSI